MDAASLMGFAVLGSIKMAERRRATESLMLSMLPGPPATRAALASVAVTQQARDSVRRERKVAAAIMSLLPELASGTPLAVALMNSPLLCDLDADEIEEDMTAIWAEYGTPRFGIELPREGDLWDRP